MTHEKLLAKINYEIDLELKGMDAESWHAGAKALRAVVELHKPLQGLVNEPFTCQACRFTIGNPVYPCPTIQQIIENLK